jgi:deoxyribodipyrimidine photolyase-related protein
MKESLFIILGNQQFPLKNIRKFKDNHVFFMAEVNELCTHFKYHKQKILFFLSSMREYRDSLIEEKYNIQYEELNKKTNGTSFTSHLNNYLSKNKNIKRITCFEVEDLFFEKIIKDYCIDKNIELNILPSPMFISSRQEFKDYLDSVKRPFMKTFYERQRKAHKVLTVASKPVGGKWSYDEDNRKKIPKGVIPPPVIFPKYDQNKNYKDCLKLISELFNGHPGEIDHFLYPINIKDAKRAFRDFLKNRFPLFGDYEDAIHSEHTFNYHSLLSANINVGHITPEEIIKAVTTPEMIKNIPINSLEGYIRQIIGWREFIRGIYQNFDHQQSTSNFWGHKKKLTNSWYTGETGVPPLDVAIKKASKYGYCHHIERLMIISNIMLLSQIDPQEVYRWFMEMFVDSSDWVMGPNVFGMAQFSDGGIFATKPYICGSNYLLKMSNYKKGEWCNEVDGLYWEFINNNRDFFSKNPRMSLSIRQYERIKPERKALIKKASKEFLKRNTTN